MSRMLRIRDSIHGMVEVSLKEMEIINTPAFQRLRYIRQLATTYMIYPGAEHTRFSHSIGTMHVASSVIRSIKSKQPDVFFKDDDANQAEKRRIHWAWMEQMLRLMALTHDLGHPPFSHAGEGLLPDGRKHEHYTKAIVLETEIKPLIDGIGAEFWEEYAVDRYFGPQELRKISAESVMELYSGENLYTDYELLLNYLMDSELDCDKMDYLLRDSHYCGVRYGQYDLERLLTAVGIGVDVDDSVKRVAIYRDGIHAFEEFVLARYFMFLQVYYHKTRRILDKTLEDYLKAKLEKGYPKNVKGYLAWNDNAVLEKLYKDAAKFSDEKTKGSKKPPSPEMEAAHVFSSRTFPRMVYQSKPHQGSSEQEEAKKAKRILIQGLPSAEIIEDNPDKLIHSIPDFIHEGEKAVYVIMEDGHLRNIRSESYVLDKVSEKIRMSRLYVGYGQHHKARTLLRNQNL